jgi:predicted TIM-barrel fold metal-dependent hydrolase
MLMPDKPQVFDFHLHYFAKGNGNLDVITGLFDKGSVGGALCITDLYVQPADAVAANKPLFETAARLGRRKMPLLATAHPSMAGWADALEKMLASSQEIVGIKLHPPVGHYTVSVDLLAPVFEIAAKRNLMIASHTCPVPGQSAIAFLPLLERFPEVPFIIYHASTHEEAAYLSIRKKVYVEPTWLGFFKPVFDMVGKLGGYNKLLAGTDGPRWFADFKGDPYEDLAALAAKMLPGRKTLHAFLYGNAAELLSL